MANLDLKTDEGLLEACKQVEAELDRGDIDKVAQFLERVHSTAPKDRSGEPFIRLVWDQNPLDVLGHGDYLLEDAYTDTGFRDEFARTVSRVLPQEGQQRLEEINGLVSHAGELAQRFTKPNKSGEQQVPWAKTLRALTALFPFDLTPPTYAVTRKDLAIAMDLPSGTGHSYQKHANRSREIIDRLDGVLGPLPDSDWKALATRRLLARRLGSLCSTLAPAWEAKLKPLPASQRKKGLVAFGGMWERLLSVVEYVNNNPAKDDLHEFMSAGSPAKKERTVSIEIYSIEKEFNAIEPQGNWYSLTDTGKKLLETRSPEAVRDWILTQILGPDHVLVALSKGARTRQDVTELLQEVNPGWKSEAAPHQMVSWLRALEVVEIDPGSNLVLTERGRQWESLIHWEPEHLEIPADNKELLPVRLAEIIERFDEYRREEELVFDIAMIEALHLGLWSNERRHFAVLTGLSGTGKTKLARLYGRALTGGEGGDHVRVFSVEPGWHDPSHLLGFVNPLSENKYQSTPFVQFLVEAIGNPSIPYVAVLDEMNLSHPEQYLAPLLSAMESDGGDVHLHALEENEAGIPQSIGYPANLVLIGTVNMDETTMGLSDKVLDRAFTLEFWDVDVDRWPGWNTAEIGAGKGDVKSVLSSLMKVLRPARLHFGWRVIEEIVRFMERWDSDKVKVLKFAEALDIVIYAKVLPKLRGDDSPRYRKALEDLVGKQGSDGVLDKSLPKSQAKVKELQEDLDNTGSFRFWR